MKLALAARVAKNRIGGFRQGLESGVRDELSVRFNLGQQDWEFDIFKLRVEKLGTFKFMRIETNLFVVRPQFRDFLLQSGQFCLFVCLQLAEKS